MMLKLVPLAAALLLLLPGAAVAQEPTAESAETQPEPFEAFGFDHVHVWLDGGATPFLSVQYAVRFADKDALVIQAKQYPHIPVYDNRVSVVETADARKLFDKLAALEATSLPDAGSKAPFALAYRVEIEIGGLAHRFVVEGPSLMDDLRYAGIIEAVIGFVQSHTGPAYFRDVVVPEMKLGLLNLRTFPRAVVAIDSVPMGGSTPLTSLEMAPGAHTATLVNEELGISRRIKFTIYEGQVTNLNINLAK